METLTLPATPADVRAAAAAFRAENPKARIRNVAAAIGVSEAELLATRCGTPEVTRLRCEPAEMLSGLAPLGPLMALTRNDACVHEKTGVYANPEMTPAHAMGLFNNDDIDLRLFFRAWHLAFFVDEDGRQSLQFFDRDGEAVHKVYATKETDVDALRALAAAYTHEDQSDAQAVEPVAPPVEKPLEELDGAAFLQGWRDLQDTHDFFPLLRKHGVSRRQAVHLAGAEAPELARKVANSAHRAILTGAAESGLPIMVFVGSRGCVQIHMGPVDRLVEMGPWYNVLDPGFNLHLNETMIAESWVVVKPTVDGVVTALEVFNAEGELIVQFFGKRKPGRAELEDWRALVATV